MEASYFSSVFYSHCIYRSILERNGVVRNQTHSTCITLRAESYIRIVYILVILYIDQIGVSEVQLSNNHIWVKPIPKVRHFCTIEQNTVICMYGCFFSATSNFDHEKQYNNLDLIQIINIWTTMISGAHTSTKFVV